MIKQTCFICLIFAYAIGIMSVEAQEQATKLQPVGEEAYQVLLHFYEYDKDIPLDARVVETKEMDNCVREKIVFTGIRGSRVPGYLAFPKNAEKPYPVVLLFHGLNLSKSSWWENSRLHYDIIMEGILKEGFAVLALDAQNHGERTYNLDYGNLWTTLKHRYIYFDMVSQSTIEYRRALDYLTTRTEINKTRIGVFGNSMGGQMTFYLSAVEPRIKVSVATVSAPIAPIAKNRYLPYDPTNFAPHIRNPFLMIMAKKDKYYTVDGGNQLFNKISSPTKNIIWYGSGHMLPIEHVEDVVNWFKEHL